MTRSARNSRDAEHLLSVFAALIVVTLVAAFLREVAVYVLAAAILWFGWLILRRKPTHTDFTVRLGVGFFIVALAVVLVRPHLNLG